MRRDPILAFAFLVALLMVYATLFPFHFASQPSRFLTWAIPDTRGNILDVLLNFYFFLPLGLLLGIRTRSRSGLLISFLAAFLLSLGVECAQAFILGRVSSLRDVFLNSIGAFTGMLIGHLPVFDKQLISTRLKNFLDRRGALTLIALWLIYQFFPFVPVLRIHRIHQTMSQPFEWFPLSFELIENAFYCLVSVFLWSTFNSPRSTVIFAMACSILAPGQLLLWGRTVSVVQVFSSIAGWWLALAVPKRPATRFASWLLPVLIGFLVWRELQPFTWQAADFHAFSWIPFEATFENPRDQALRILCLKCFLYWSTQSLMHQVYRIPLLRCAAIVAGILLIAEFGQCFQAGRSPEITDSLLCLIGAIPFWNFEQETPDANQSL